MHDYELDAWLGDFADQASDDQRDRISRAWQRIEERYPIPADGELADVREDREAALSAAVQVILDDMPMTAFVDRWSDLNRQAMAAQVAMTGALIAEAQEETKIEIHRRTGLARMTIDKAVG